MFPKTKRSSNHISKTFEIKKMINDTSFHICLHRFEIFNSVPKFNFEI